MSADDIATLWQVRNHLKALRTFLAIEVPEAVGTRRRNDLILAELSDLLTRNGAA